MKLLINVFSAAGLIFLGGLLSSQAVPTGTQVVQQIGTVFVIALENHNFTQPTPTSSPEQLLTNPAAPYFNSLITPGNSNAAYVSYATKYYNAGIGVHPSEPNYVWAEAGTDFGVHIDSDPTSANGNIYTAPHLVAQLNTARISWKNYQEDVQLTSGPGVSLSGTSTSVTNPYYHTKQFGYAAKHNPMVFFSDTATQNVYPLTSLAADLANNTVGRYNWITPNLYNDQHTALSGGFIYHGTNFTSDQAAVAQGDNFLSIIVPQIMASTAWQNNGAIIIRMDETEGGDSTSYTIPEIVISRLAKGNAYASSMVMSHSSDIKTMEEMLGLSFLSNAIPSGETMASGSGYNNVATVNDLSDMFRAEPVIGVQEPAGYNLASGSSSVAFGSTYPGTTVTNIFTATNSGIGSLTVSNMTLTGADASDFAIGGIDFPDSVATNAVATFRVTFSPSTSGSRSATLQITNNDPIHSLFTIYLTGAGATNSEPVFSDNGVPTTNGFQLTFSADVGQHYRILASDDVTQPLTNWIVVASGTVEANPVIFTDTAAMTNNGQFYRVVSP